MLSLTPQDVRGKRFYYGKGCNACNNTGYKGRVGIFELMVLDDELREVIMEGGSTGMLRDVAMRHGMRSLRESGLLAIYDGMTTIEEVVRETIMAETLQ
jgi:type IV pilus assembly protein PilB